MITFRVPAAPNPVRTILIRMPLIANRQRMGRASSRAKSRVAVDIDTFEIGEMELN
jgi:hypothetical protein